MKYFLIFMIMFSQNINASEIDYLSGNPENGKVLIKPCTECHSLEEPGLFNISKAGSIFGVFGKKVGSGEGFRSDELKSLGGVWDGEKLYKYIGNPKSYVPGTKMDSKPIADKKVRLDIIAYIYTLK